MLAGQRPFRGRGTELIDAVLGAPIPRLRQVAPAVHADLDDIVARLLARDPLQRFALAAEVASRLEMHAERAAPSLAQAAPERAAWFAESTVQTAPVPPPAPALAPALAPPPLPAPAPPPAAAPPPAREAEASDSALTLPFQPSVIRRAPAAPSTQPSHVVEKTVVMAGFEAPADLLPNGANGWGPAAQVPAARPTPQPQPGTPWPAPAQPLGGAPPQQQPQPASWPYAAASTTAAPGAGAPASLEMPAWMRPAPGAPLRPIVIAAGIFVGVAALVLIGLYIGLSGSRPDAPETNTPAPTSTAAPKR
jgi:hypothetical protein